MRREPIDARRPLRRRRGFALVAALAVLVLVASLGSMMLRLASVEQAASSTAILGARAHFAAQSGIEWGLHAVLGAEACPAASTPLTLAEGALTGFRVEVRCTSSTHSEGSRLRTRFELRANAAWGAPGARDHVVREMSATAVL